MDRTQDECDRAWKNLLGLGRDVMIVKNVVNPRRFGLVATEKGSGALAEQGVQLSQVCEALASARMTHAIEGYDYWVDMESLRFVIGSRSLSELLVDCPTAREKRGAELPNFVGQQAKAQR